MSLYQCEKCGVIENTAVGFYHCRDLFDWSEEFKGKKLCSECGPPRFPGGEETGWGKWHGMWEKKFYPIGTMETDEQGNVRQKNDHKET